MTTRQGRRRRHKRHKRSTYLNKFADRVLEWVLQCAAEIAKSITTPPKEDT